MLAGHSAYALSVSEAISFVLETNPEIKSAEANKQAIEFELEQARSFFAPRFSLDAWAGTSLNNGTTLPDLTSADDAISGYEVSARVSQLLFDGHGTRSEVERQAYRIDSAAFRVLERSEVLSLEAIRLYSDVLRGQALLRLAHENLAYHQDVQARMQKAYDQGVVGIGDLDQIRERTVLAQDTIYEFELGLEDSKTMFLAIVGTEATNLGSVASVSRAVPANLDKALAIARNKNPSILFLQADVGSAEALSRRVDANKFPGIYLEGEVRAGEDVSGYEGDVMDARVGIVMRYVFQGSSKKAARQEQIRRVSESRSQLLAQTRRVETEVRQSWSTMRAAQRRKKTINAQAKLSRKLRTTYEEEFLVGTRSLLDVLNTQAALFQAEANLVNANVLENYVQYRLLASAGVLLPTLGITPPEDAKAYARKAQGAPAINQNGDTGRFDAKSFKEWRSGLK